MKNKKRKPGRPGEYWCEGATNVVQAHLAFLKLDAAPLMGGVN